MGVSWEVDRGSLPERGPPQLDVRPSMSPGELCQGTLGGNVGDKVYIAQCRVWGAATQLRRTLYSIPYLLPILSDLKFILPVGYRWNGTFQKCGCGR